VLFGVAKEVAPIRASQSWSTAAAYD